MRRAADAFRLFILPPMPLRTDRANSGRVAADGATHGAISPMLAMRAVRNRSPEAIAEQQNAARRRRPAKRSDAAAQGTPHQRSSGRGVLQLLERTDLDLHRGRLGGEPLLFLGERVDALALRLGRHADGGDLQ